jgi:heme A synthase
MPRVPLECILMLGYAVSLALIALVLEWLAHHAQRRSLGLSTAGFTYHPDRDIWRCPEDQRLLPVFSDSVRRTVTYRAPAAACNACPSKAACTDSSQGREIERSDLSGLEHGMKRFHRALSLTLLVLASVILVVELVRTRDLYPRIVLAATLTLFCLLIQHLSAKLSQSTQDSQSSQNASM